MKINKKFVGTLAVAAFAIQIQAQPFLTNGLVAYYPLDGNAYDVSGNSNNGTLVGATAFGVDRFGNSNACLSLSGGVGKGTGVNVPALANLPYQPVTYSAWFVLNSYPPTNSSVMPLLGRDECGSQSEGSLCIYPTSVANPMLYYCGGTDFPMSTVPPTNQWCHVVLTIDGSGHPTFYLNGANLGTGNAVPSGSGMPFWIGCSAPGGCTAVARYIWNGLIDDVRVYNRPLSSTEVEQLYEFESGTEECVPHPATATATETNGFVVGINLTDIGCGYTNTPLVAFVGGGGTGAAGVAVVTNGFVQQIVITNTGSGYTSAPAVFIGEPSSFTVQPESLTVNAHGPASFSASAFGPPAPQYQWLFDGTNLSGATNSVLTFSNVVQTNLGSYAVIASNVFGSATSSTVVLSMYPYLLQPFGGLDTDWGYTNTLSITAWGTGPLSYQWFNNGTPIDGATNSVLTFDGIQFTNGGLYTVVVSNSYGTTTNAPEQVVVNPSGISLGLYPGVTVTGVVGYNYIIQSTTNLSNTNAWITVANLTLTQPVQLWLDTNVDTTLPGNPHRYYQILPGQ